MSDQTPTKVTAAQMLVIAMVIFVGLFLYLALAPNNSMSDDLKRLIRVLTALAAGAVSMSLSGTINVGTQENNVQTMAEKAPKITAAGSLAVFVLVYLVDPLRQAASEE